MANVPGQSPAARARSKRSRHLVRVLSSNPRFSAGRSEGARLIPARADQGWRVAIPRTSTAAHAEPGERGDAGQGPPRRRSRDSESSPALVALREGKELINRMPHQRGGRRPCRSRQASQTALLIRIYFVHHLLMVSLTNKRQLLVCRITPLFRHWRNW